MPIFSSHADIPTPPDQWVGGDIAPVRINLPARLVPQLEWLSERWSLNMATIKPLTRYEAIAQEALDREVLDSLRTKEEKESDNARQLIVLGILLLLLGLAVANS